MREGVVLRSISKIPSTVTKIFHFRFDSEKAQDVICFLKTVSLVIIRVNKNSSSISDYV